MAWNRHAIAQTQLRKHIASQFGAGHGPVPLVVIALVDARRPRHQSPQFALREDVALPFEHCGVLALVPDRVRRALPSRLSVIVGPVLAQMKRDQYIRRVESMATPIRGPVFLLLRPGVEEGPAAWFQYSQRFLNAFQPSFSRGKMM